TVGQLRGDRAQERTRVVPPQRAGDGSQQVCPVPERLTLEARRSEQPAVLGERGQLTRPHGDRLRDEECVARDAARCEIASQVLEEHALVRRVLVDQDDAAGALAEEIAIEYLPDEPERRESLRARLPERALLLRERQPRGLALPTRHGRR